MKAIDFIKIAIKDYKRVGAVTITSKHAIKKIIKELKPGYKYIVEYGAGNGVITKEILKHLPADGKIIAIELNDVLFHELTKISDKRVIPLRKNVVDVASDFSSLGLSRIDAVISGIPFSFLKPSVRKEVVDNTNKAIAEGGKFILYQTSLLMLPHLKKFFKKVRYYLELRNIPPYFIMIGER